MGLDEDDEQLLSDLCLYCNIRTPIYTCPRCFAQSCSVACYKKHKVYKQCTGQRDPTAFVKRSKLMTNTGINRDYNFLTSLERTIDRTTENLQATVENGVTAEGDDKIAQQQPKKHLSRKNEKVNLERLLVERCTKINWAPWEGFQKAKMNRTKVRKGRIWWTIEWILADAPHCGKKVLEHRITDLTVVWSTFRDSKNLDEGFRRSEIAGSDKRFGFYLVLQAPGKTRRCVKINRMQNWKDNLRERTVIEYPEVLVTMRSEGPEGWEVISDNRRIVVLDDEKPQDKQAAINPPPPLPPPPPQQQPGVQSQNKNKIPPSRFRNQRKRKHTATREQGQSGAGQGEGANNHYERPREEVKLPKLE